MFTISIFEGTEAHQTRIVADVLQIKDYPGLSKEITKHLWAPGRFADNIRDLAHFQSMNLFVADIDGDCTIEGAKQIFARYQCMIGTTRSHGVAKGGKGACDRFRVIIPLAEPITNDQDFKATWFAVQKLCPAIDPACKDSSRFYFPCVEIVAQWDGQPFPVTRYIAPEPKPHIETSSQQKLTPSKRTLKFLAMGAEDGRWHHELVAACMDMKQQQWEQADAAAALERITGSLDEHDTGVIDDVWNNREPRHPPRDPNSEAVRNLINKCHLIQDLSPRRETLFLNRAEGKTYNIDVLRAAQALGKQQWSEYLQSNKLDCFFDYDPFKKPLTPSDVGILTYNTYRPAAWRHNEFWFNKPIPKQEQLPEIFDRFFNHLTAGHGPSKEYLLDWMANSLKTRNFTILTAIGNQGVGKGILAEMFKHLHGEVNYCQPKDDVFKERFNGPLKNKTLVNVDEISLKTKEEHDRLKAVVNDWIDIEEKGMDAVNCRNYANFYISSNHLDAIQVEPGDRRYSVIQLATQKLIETDLRNNINYLTDPRAIGQLGAYLLYRQITHDMLQPFRSPRFEEVRLAGLNDWELFMVEEFCPLHAGKTLPISFVITEIKEALELRALGRRRLTELQKKFPEKFKIIQDPKDKGKRLVAVTG